MKKPGPAPLPLVKPASPQEALSFVRKLYDIGKSRTPASRQAVAQFVDGHSVAELRGIARRIMMDVMKGPIPPEERSKGDPDEKAPAPASGADEPASAPRKPQPSGKGPRK
jgi:hypothetical protein